MIYYPINNNMIKILCLTIFIHDTVYCKIIKNHNQYLIMLWYLLPTYQPKK